MLCSCILPFLPLSLCCDLSGWETTKVSIASSLAPTLNSKHLKTNSECIKNCYPNHLLHSLRPQNSKLLIIIYKWDTQCDASCSILKFRLIVGVFFGFFYDATTIFPTHFSFLYLTGNGDIPSFFWGVQLEAVGCCTRMNFCYSEQITEVWLYMQSAVNEWMIEWMNYILCLLSSILYYDLASKSVVECIFITYSFCCVKWFYHVFPIKAGVGKILETSKGS